MAKLKMLKLPKKPKASASLEAKQKYLHRVKAIQSENQKRHKINQESERLSKVIAGIGSVTVRPSGFSSRVVRKSKSKRKKSAHKKHKVSGVRKRRASHKRRR